MVAMTRLAHTSGTFAIGGELTVHRLGFGAMRLPGVRGEPQPSEAREVLREAARLGVDLIDTAHAYGRSEEMIAVYERTSAPHRSSCPRPTSPRWTDAQAINDSDSSQSRSALLRSSAYAATPAVAPASSSSRRTEASLQSSK